MLWLVIIIMFIWLKSEISTLRYEIKNLKKQQGSIDSSAIVQEKDEVVTTSYEEDLYNKNIQKDLLEKANINNYETPAYIEKKKIEPGIVDIYLQSLMSWMKIDWPMKVGSLIFFIGILWFMSYAIVNNWISPSARIAIGILLGIGFALLGYIRHNKYPDQGSLLLGMGAGIYILSVFIGFKFYGFFAAGNIGIIMILLQYFIIGAIAYKSKNKTLLMLSFFYSAIGPFIVNSGSHNYIGLMTYLIILSTAQITCSLATGRKSIRVMPIIFYIIYFLSSYYSIKSGDVENILGSVTFSLINVLFFAIIFGAEFYEIYKQKYDITNLVYIAIAAVGLLGYSITISTIGSYILGIACIVFFVLWFILSKRNDDRLNNLLITSYIGFAAGLLYLQYSGNDLAIGLTLLCTISSVASLFITKSVSVQRYSLVFWVLPIVNILWLYVTGTMSETQNYTNLLLLGLCAFDLGILTKYYLDTDEANEVVFIEKLLGVVALTLYIRGSFEGHLMIGLLAFFGLFIIIISNYIQKPSFTFVFRSATMIAPLLGLAGLGGAYIGGNYNDLMNFILFEAIAIILVISQYLELSHHTENNIRKDYTSVLFYGAIWVFCLFYGFTYIVPSEYLAVVYLIITAILYKISLHYKQYKISESVQYLFFVPIVFSMQNMIGYSITPNLISYFLFALFAVLMRGLFVGQKRYTKDTNYIFYGLFIMYTFFFFRKGTHYIIEDSSATIVSLIIFTLLGIGFYTNGKRHTDKQQIHIGSIIVIGVILRIFFVELWQMTLIGRIVTCVIIGLLLIGSGYIGNRNKEKEVISEKIEEKVIN